MGGRPKTAVARSRRIELNKERRRADRAALVGSVQIGRHRHVLTRSNVVAGRETGKLVFDVKTNPNVAEFPRDVIVSAINKN
jgi:hypothetical protein